MHVSTAAPGVEFQRLRAEYQDAWKRLRLEVDRWQSLTARGIDGKTMEEAKDEVARAEASYRHARNLMAECLIARAAEKGDLSLAVLHQSDRTQWRREKLACFFAGISSI